MFYLGVDGGGTKTSFLLIDETGKLLATTTTGTCHIHQVGFDGFENVLRCGIEDVCHMANITLPDITFSFLGVPAYGENQKELLKMEQHVQNIFPSNNFKCGNDVEAGWAGSLACNPGINLILGTGAIALGVDKENNCSRSSGWGHICGDEGSAHWIAKKGIEIFSKEADGRLDKTPLYDVFKNRFNLTSDFDLIYLILDNFKQDRGKVASLATLVYEAATKNDPHAIEIFRQAAYECFLMVKSVFNQLSFNETVTISYSGSVFNSGELILAPLKDYLSSANIDFKLIPPVLNPVEGSALYALKLHTGKENLETIVSNMQY